MTSVSHLFPFAAHHYSASIKKCVKLCNLKITILHPVTQNLMALRKMLFDSKLQLTWETNNSRCQWELWRTNKKLQNTSNIKKIQVGNISRRAVKRILQNIKDKPIWKKKEKKKRITVKYLSLHIPEALGPEPSDAKESSTLFKRMLCTTSNSEGKK